MPEIVKTFTYPKGKVTVRQPVLTEEEYNRRLKQVSRAAVAVLKEQQKAERNRENEKICI